MFGGAAKGLLGLNVAVAGSTDAVEIIELSATAAVELIRRGDLSAERYASALIQQMHLYRDLNTVTHIDEQHLLEAAREVDYKRASGKAIGPLGGLPIMFKDNINTVGFPTTAGTAFLKNYMPKTNAPLVDILYRNGGILFAKANMHELAMGSTSANLTFGAVKNPYDLSRIAGGSTGGGAAALAARIVAVAFGTDTSGSCRMPAHFCGVAGFRPSNPKGQRAYSVDGIVPNVLDFDIPGPLARTVADIALIDAAVCGAPVPPAADLRGVRLGVPRVYFWETLDLGLEAEMNTALDKLRAAGATLVDIDLGDIVRDSLPPIRVLNAEGKRVDLASYLAREVPSITMADAIAGVAGKSLRARLQLATDKPVGAEAVQKARAAMDSLGHQYDLACRAAGVTAIVFPAVPVPAPLLPIEGDALPAKLEINGWSYPDSIVLRNALLAPFFRVPALTIPAGLVSGRLPVAIELNGLAGDDTRLLAVGMAIEKVLGPMPTPNYRNG
jgi:mandelamide amidase